MTTIVEAGSPAGRVLSTSAALSLAGITKTYSGGGRTVDALVDVDLHVNSGEVLSVVGASGCGKSTLLSIVAGLETPTSGALRAQGPVALMFQDATLLPWLSARGNVELALELRGVPRGERADRARALLDVVRLGDAVDQRPHELSGGMRQRVALARCLAQDARIVLMDEPLAALDAMTRDHLHDEIERVALEQHLTVLLVTHNMREAVRLADRVVLMSTGRIVHEQVVDLPHPRRMDSPEIATRAADLTARLRASSAGGPLA